MKVIYESEKVALLQKDDLFIIHILDDYRLIKEINTNRKNLFSVLSEELDENNKSKKILRRKSKTVNNKISTIESIKKVLKTIY
jgi:hypothetical protein